MKKISKILKSALFVLLAVSMLFGVVACGEDETGNNNGVLDHEPVVKGKLEVAARREAYSTAASQQGVRSWVADFQKKYPEVDVTVNFGVSQENYPALVSSKTMSDVYALWDEVVYTYAIKQEALLPLDHYIEAFDIDLSQVYQGIYNLGVVDGKTYFLGATCGQQTFVYNLGAVKEANILPDGQDRISNSWTWEDFKNYAAALTKINPDTNQYEQVAASFPVWHDHYFMPFLTGFGGKWYDSVNKRITLTEDNVLRGVNELISVLEKGYVFPTTNSAVEIGSEWGNKFANINTEQGAVFQFNAAYTNLVAKGQTLDQQGIEWDIAPFPLFEKSASPCGTLGFGVFKYSTNLDAAAALVCSLYTEDGQLAYHSQSGGDIPIIKTLGEQDFWHLKTEGWENKNYAAFTANYDRYVPGHVSSYVPAEIATIISTRMNEFFKNWYKGNATVQDALETIQTECNNMWSTLS